MSSNYPLIPTQGIVQGPREFAEGVVIGMNSFLRHSVGGIVGAASKVSFPSEFSSCFLLDNLCLTVSRVFCL